MKQVKKNILLMLSMLSFTLSLSPAATPGENLWHVLADIGTDVDLIISKIDECCGSTFTALSALDTFISDEFNETFTVIETIFHHAQTIESKLDICCSSLLTLTSAGQCDATPLSQSNAIGGTILLTATGQSYCLTQNVTANITIGASNVSLDLNMHSLNGRITILGTAKEVVIKNGNVKPLAPTSSAETAIAGINIASGADNTLIKNVYVLCVGSFTTSVSGRPGILSSGRNTIIDSCFVQAGNGNSGTSGVTAGGTGITFNGINGQILNSISYSGNGGSGVTVAGAAAAGAAGAFAISLASGGPHLVSNCIAIGGNGGNGGNSTGSTGGAGGNGNVGISIGTSNSRIINCTVTSGMGGNGGSSAAGAGPAGGIGGIGINNGALNNQILDSKITTGNGGNGGMSVTGNGGNGGAGGTGINNGSNAGVIRECKIVTGNGGIPATPTGTGTFSGGTGGASGVGIFLSSNSFVVTQCFIITGSGMNGGNGSNNASGLGGNGGAGGASGAGISNFAGGGANADQTILECVIITGSAGSGGNGGIGQGGGNGGAAGASGSGFINLTNAAFHIIKNKIITGNGGNGGMGGESTTAATAGTGGNASFAGRGIVNSSANVNILDNIIVQGNAGHAGTGGNNSSTGAGGAGGTLVTPLAAIDNNGSSVQIIRNNIIAGNSGNGGNGGTSSGGTAGAGGIGGTAPAGILNTTGNNIHIGQNLILTGSGGNGGNAGTGATGNSGGIGGSGGIGINNTGLNVEVIDTSVLTGPGGNGGASTTGAGAAAGSGGVGIQTQHAISITSSGIKILQSEVKQTGFGGIGGSGSSIGANGTRGTGILIDGASATNNIIEETLVTQAHIGFAITSTGKTDCIRCVAAFNDSHGFDFSSTTSSGLIQECISQGNRGCGFNDRPTSLFKYVSNVSEGNGSTPAQTSGDSNYCTLAATTTLSASGMGSTPYFQNARNTNGTFNGISFWDNITLR